MQRTRAANLILILMAGAASATTIFDFEGIPDSTVLTTQYPGVTFSDAVILKAGISLNEFEFPPSSGVNVASDDGGPMTITFASPVLSFGGYFTYLEPLTLTAFDGAGDQVATATSAYESNMALSGDPGSSPDEWITVAFTGGISSVTITGDPAGGSFTLDDATYTTAAPSAVPESATTLLFLLGGLVLIGFHRAFH